jgi:hypothetical protein
MSGEPAPELTVASLGRSIVELTFEDASTGGGDERVRYAVGKMTAHMPIGDVAEIAAYAAMLTVHIALEASNGDWDVALDVIRRVLLEQATVEALGDVDTDGE